MNSVCSRWVDVVEMAKAQDVDVTNEEGETITEAFLAAMETIGKRDKTGFPAGDFPWFFPVATVFSFSYFGKKDVFVVFT